MKRFVRILSAILCLTMLIPSLAMTVSAASPATSKAVPEALPELESLSSYLHASASTEDNTSHLPVNIYTYYDENKEYVPAKIGEAGSVSILYVMNTNTERLGRKSDAELIQSFLDRGFFVLVLDYQNNPAATGTALDWSVQDIRCQVIGGNCFAGGKMYTGGAFTDGKLTGIDSICAQSYILPAGYDIMYNIPYYSYDKHGVAGTFENIVEIWNNDFKSVKRNTIVKWVDENGMPRLDLTDAITEKAPQDKTNIDYATWFKSADGRNGISQAKLETLSTEEQKQYQYTYIGNTIVKEVTDCVQPDGTMIELTLYMDILYPSDYSGELPVMIAMSSSYTRASSWTSDTRPYLNGPLFNGYVGVVSDYGLVPMCRNDHYGYFCGDSQLNSVSGDNGTYSLSYYNGIHSDTALLRTIRKIGVEGMDVEGYGYVSAPINPTKIGAYGNSKAGVIVRLANPTPEKLAELRNYEGHKGETRLEVLEGNYPYVDPYIENGATTDARIDMPEAQPALTYSNGETIHSGLNFVFANCGGAFNTLTEGSAPIYGVGTQAGGTEGSYYTYYAKTANFARNLDIPFFGLVAPKIAHDLGYGLDKDYGLDIYESYNRYANYWLRDDNAECIIVDVDTTKDIWVASDVVMDNVYEITEDSSIKLQFTGPISAYEIEKVQIRSLTDGKQLNGEWQGSYGNQQWKFIPYDIKDATYYTIVVPSDIVADNGKNLKETVTHTFRTANGVTEDAVSVTQIKQVSFIDCVSALPNDRAADGYSWTGGGIFGTNSEGFLFNLNLITSNYNENQNFRLNIFNDIWADPTYVGKTVRFSFDAKVIDATDPAKALSGDVELSLTQTGSGNKYRYGTGFGALDATASVTNEWQTFTYEFTVTQEMYDAMADGTIASPGLGLAFRFPGFTDGTAYDKVKFNIRNVNVSTSAPAADPSLTTNDFLYFTFKDQDYSTAHDVTLRFAVANNAANTVGVYTASGEKLGEVIVTGAGIYNFDVTDYVKSCGGSPVVAVKIENEVGSTILNNFNYESDATGEIYFNAISKSVVTNEVPNADGTPNNSVKYEYMVANSQWIDLDNNLVSKHIYSLSSFASHSGAIRIGSFAESDMGRRFRVSFRVYDETSRVFSVTTGYGYNIANSVTDYKGTNYSFYTTAGQWTTVTFEFTVDDAVMLGDNLKKNVLIFETENKGIATLDKNTAVNVSGMSHPSASRPGNYAGDAGLNDSYDKYTNVDQAEAAGKVTFYDDLSYALYLDDLVVEEVATRVEVASCSPKLSITPTATEDLLPTVSASVLSTEPNAPQDGLWIGGGKDGFDTNSVKSYVKLSLEEYYGGFAAFFFRASGAANVSVYGVADVNAGESWSSDTITSANAPANNIYGSGVNLNAVYGNKPLATFAVGNDKTNCLVDLTDFADYMMANGAKEITLVIVSDTDNVTKLEIAGAIEDTIVKIAEFDGVTNRPAQLGAGFSGLDESTYTFYVKNDEGIGVDLRTAHKDTVKPTSNTRFAIFDTIWSSKSYIGKTIRFSFDVKATETGSIEIGLNQRQKYAFANFPGLSGTADVSTDWQTYTFEFVVTEEMYTIVTSGSDANGIQPPGLQLGIHFNGFNDGTGKYKGAQIIFRNFEVNMIKSADSETVKTVATFDGVTKVPTGGGAGFSLDTTQYPFNFYNSEGMGVDLRTAHKDVVKTTSNAKFEIFNAIWADTSNVGKTVRFSFSAKSTMNGSIEIGLNQRQKYAFNMFPGLSGTADLTSEWQTFTYEFEVTQAMYDIITNGSDANGIQQPGLALGVHFAGFDDGNGKYKGAQITFRNFVVSTVEYNEAEESDPILNQYDFASSKPAVTASGYSGSNLWSITDGALEFYAGKIGNGNGNQNFRISAFDNILGTHTENIGKTFRVVFKAKATMAGRLDVSLNTGSGGKGNPAKPNGAFDIYPEHTWAFDLTEEYQTFSFTFVALEGMYDTTSYATIQLGVRLFNGFHNGMSYNDATIYMDDLVVLEDPYVRSVDVNYDFESNKPAVDFRGYSTQIGSVSNGEVEIKPITNTGAVNSGQYARIAALQQIWANRLNAGKTFTITFRAKATEPGSVDFAINKTGTWENYSYSGKTYAQQYDLTTEYQTFTYTFMAVEDMFDVNAVTTLDCAFRFYNGFTTMSDGSRVYKDATIYIDDVHVYEELDITESTIGITDSIAVSGSGNSTTLTVFADNTVNGSPEIQKTYLSYDLTDVQKVYASKLGVNLLGANGETVKVYVLADVVLPTSLTYSNAPAPIGAPAASFTARDGMNYVDLTDAISACIGKNAVIILAIEEPSDKIQITSMPELNVVRDYHDYTSESQRHPAVEPTTNTVGNVEFYTCNGCDKLYVKNGDEFVEVTVEDVIIPVATDGCKEHNLVDGVCTVCGYHECRGGSANCTDKAVCSVCGKTYGDLAPDAHAWDNGSVTKNPTCEEKGTITYTCANNSKHIYTNEIPEIGHNYNTVVTESTCTTDGFTTYTCNNCGDSYVDNKITAKGHADADKNYVCDVCGADLCVDHEIIILEAKAPTCTESGLTEGKKCAICGETILAQTEIPALGHTRGEVVVENNVDPDCVNNGSYDNVVYCTVCGEELERQTVTVDALGHKYNEEITAPTCTDEGYTTYTCGCGDIYVTNYVPALGHTDGDVHTENVVEPDCENEGKYDNVTYCTVCGTETSRDTVTTDAVGHEWLDATTEAPKTCKNCGKTEGDKLPEMDDEPVDTPDEPTTEKDHSECEGGAFQKLINALINFFRGLFGLPEKCVCGEELE